MHWNVLGRKERSSLKEERNHENSKSLDLYSKYMQELFHQKWKQTFWRTYENHKDYCQTARRGHIGHDSPGGKKMNNGGGQYCRRITSVSSIFRQHSRADHSCVMCSLVFSEWVLKESLSVYARESNQSKLRHALLLLAMICSSDFPAPNSDKFMQNDP